MLLCAFFILLSMGGAGLGCLWLRGGVSGRQDMNGSWVTMDAQVYLILTCSSSVMN